MAKAGGGPPARGRETGRETTEGWTLCPVQGGFFTHIGPFWEGPRDVGSGDMGPGDVGGRVRAFVADERHLGPGGLIHTAVLGAFAELVCQMALADDGVPEGEAALLAITLTHLASAPRGTLVQGAARLNRRNWAHLCAEVQLHDNGRPLVTGTALWSVGAG